VTYLSLIPCLAPPLALLLLSFFFFFNHTPPTEIYTLSLHDALPISAYDDGRVEYRAHYNAHLKKCVYAETYISPAPVGTNVWVRSEEHTSELQSLTNLVCRLLLEKKKKKHRY